MEKITNKAINKIGNIVEIIMVLLDCNYTDAFEMVLQSNTGKAIISGDMATMYQSAACCVEDIGKELSRINNPYAKFFSDINLNKAMDYIRIRNQQNIQRYNQMVV